MQSNQSYLRNDPCLIPLPGEVDVCVGPNDCKVRADVALQCVHSVLIWGTVTDCRGCPVPGATVKLLRYTGDRTCNLTEICRTRADAGGNYQFDLTGDSTGRYRVLVSPCVEEQNSYPIEKSFQTESCSAQNSSCRSYSAPCRFRSDGCNSIQYY